MSDNTKIEWAQATWNPISGCTKVSAGCDNCYAETLAERFRGTPGHYYEHGFDVQLRPEKLDQPLRWRRPPRRIFVNSMSDLFHDSVPDEYIGRVFAIMALANHHTFQVLTKRHARMRSLLNNAEWREQVQNHVAWYENPPDVSMMTRVRWPLPNVWLGVSAENQQWADIRIPALLDTPAAVRWVSAEPLLGALDLRKWLAPQQSDSLGRLVSLDDQVRQDGLEERNYVSSSTHSPRPHGLPAAALDTFVVPPDDSADSTFEPVDDFRRGAVDGDSDAASGLGHSAPVQIPFTVEHPGDVAEHGRICRDGDALRRSSTALPAGNAARLVNPSPDRGSGAAHTVGDLLNSLPGDVSGERVVGGDRVSLHNTHSPTLDWVVAGGESGRGARPMHPDWARGLRDQCQAAGVAFLFKQWGEWVKDVTEHTSSDGETYRVLNVPPDHKNRNRCALHLSGGTAMTPDNPFHPFRAGHGGWTAMRRVGKKAAGRELDGREWNEYPA